MYLAGIVLGANGARYSDIFLTRSCRASESGTVIGLLQATDDFDTVLPSVHQLDKREDQEDVCGSKYVRFQAYYAV